MPSDELKEQRKERRCESCNEIRDDVHRVKEPFDDAVWNITNWVMWCPDCHNERMEDI